MAAKDKTKHLEAYASSARVPVPSYTVYPTDLRPAIRTGPSDVQMVLLEMSDYFCPGPTYNSAAFPDTLYVSRLLLSCGVVNTEVFHQAVQAEFQLFSTASTVNRLPTIHHRDGRGAGERPPFTVMLWSWLWGRGWRRGFGIVRRLGTLLPGGGGALWRVGRPCRRSEDALSGSLTLLSPLNEQMRMRGGRRSPTLLELLARTR